MKKFSVFAVLTLLVVTAQLVFGQTPVARQLEKPNATILYTADNLFDLGSVASGRPRTIYVGTSIVAPTLTLSGGLTVPSLAVTNTSNQIVLSTGNTATFNVTGLTAPRTFTFPDASGQLLSLGAVNAGQVFFGTTTLAQDSNFFWDNATKRLGIGTSSPASPLSILTNFAGFSLQITNANAAGQGLNIIPGIDSSAAAVINNAANTVARHQFFGNGNVIIGSGGAGFYNFGSTLTTGANAGDIILRNTGTYRAVNNAGTSTLALLTSTGTDRISFPIDAEFIGRIFKYNNAAPTDGQLLIGNTAGTRFDAAALTAGAGVLVTNGAGTITLGADTTVRRVLDRNVTMIEDINNAAPVTIYTFAVAGGTLSTNREIRLHLVGDYLNGSGGGVNLVVQATFGATVVCADTTTPASSGSRRSFEIELTISGQNATNAQVAACTVTVGAAATNLGIAAAPNSRDHAVHTAVVEDGTVNRTLLVQITHGSAAATVSLKKFTAQLEVY